MSLHDELLAQAERLVQSNSGSIDQVDLRRAVSSAYYALFHLLAWEFASLYVRDSALAAKLVRTLNHDEMRKTSKNFIESSPTLPQNICAPGGTGSVSPEDLSTVARSFVDLQRSRHDADYDLAKDFEEREALNIVASARDAFEAWRKIRDTDWARIYLACLQHWKAWDGKRG